MKKYFIGLFDRLCEILEIIKDMFVYFIIPLLRIILLFVAMPIVFGVISILVLFDLVFYIISFFSWLLFDVGYHPTLANRFTNNKYISQYLRAIS